MAVNHPYYPIDLALTNYAPPASSAISLLAIMATLSLGLLTLGWHLTRWIRPTSSSAERAKVCWFFFSANMHLFFEGYFVFSRTPLASNTSLPAELWKEYALSDSRYLSGDPFVRGIETLTVLFLGPLAMFTAFSIASGSPQRYALTILTCLGHIYGALLYFTTELVDDVSHCRPEFVYYWVYFVGFNIAWIIVPARLGWEAYQQICLGTRMTEAARYIQERRSKRSMK